MGYSTVGILHAAVAGQCAQWDAAVSADTETLALSTGQVLFFNLSWQLLVTRLTLGLHLF